MRVTIRGVDADAYGLVKARAAREGRSIGEVLSQMIDDHDRSHFSFQKTGSLADVRPVPFPKGNERLSEQIDDVVYGARKPR